MKLFLPGTLNFRALATWLGGAFSLTLTLSRWEREQPLAALLNFCAVEQKPAAVLPRRGNRCALFQRERAGVRENASLLFVAIIFCFASVLGATETNFIQPVTARDFFNVGTKFLAAKKFADAEKMFSSSLAAQDERVQAVAEFNLGHTRFADGAEILKKGPDAQKVFDQGNHAMAAGDNALRAGENSLAENQMDKMVSAYLAGRGARKELRAAEKAVKSAMETYGKTLAKWQRAEDDFKGAAELNSADTNAPHNAAVVEREIAKLVDTLRKMQGMAGKMAGQKDQLGKMLSKLKGQIPAPDAPPGGKGEDDDEEKDDGSGKGDVKPESLKGKEENAGRDGEQLSAPLSPDQAGQMLDGLPVDTRKRLPMGGDQQGTPPKEKNGRNW